MTFKVGDKVTSEAFGDGVVDMLNKDGLYSVMVDFGFGKSHWFTIEGHYSRDGSSPHKNIKHKEAKGMNKSDLKTGMVVGYRNGDKRIVLADVGLLVGDAWKPLSEYSLDLINGASAYNEFTIVKVYSQPTKEKDYLNTSLENRTLIWQREEVKEMTVDEISKALGYTVKVVGGE